MNERILKAFNTHLNKELYSSYLYLSMASYFNSINMEGFEHWMKAQAAEEMLHVLKFYQFITQKSGRLLLTEVAAPPTDWESSIHAFEDSLEHEKSVSKAINDLVYLSREEKDYSCEAFLTWFVTEQVEEEATVKNLLEKLKFIGDNPHALLMLDNELKARPLIFTLATPV